MGPSYRVSKKRKACFEKAIWAHISCFSSTIREARYKLISQFARPGGPGAKFKNQLEKMFKALTLPKGAREELGIGEDGSMPADDSEEEVQKNEEDE